MQILKNIDNLVRKLSNEKDIWTSLAIAIDLTDEILKSILPNQSNWYDILANNSQETGSIPTPLPQDVFHNNKQFTWFHEHPTAKSVKVALQHFEADDCDIEANFFWFSEKASKQKISTATQYTTNWEDNDLYKQGNNKIGIDFFLSHDTNSLMLVITNGQNIRALELSDHLSNTQKEIFTDHLFRVFDGVSDSGNQELIHARLWDALKLSEVNNKFYQGIVIQFNVLSSTLMEVNGKTKNEAKQFSSRLLGRLLFVWFLRKMNIIDESYEYFKVGDDSSEYYDKALKNLFFNTLNTPVDDRKHSDNMTPYLNGGLFEEKDGDFSREFITFPDNFFNQVYEHFNSFNFTTDESSPDFEVVAVDPEMLGQIFESLLAQEIDEKNEQSNKRSKTGAFYTPKYIVNYICTESLRQHLYRELGNETFNEGVDRLLDYSDSEFMAAKSSSTNEFLWGVNAKRVLPKVVKALKSVKIIDPAVGSGAFPIGMMQVLTRLFERLLPASEFDPFQIKLHIIENNLYGVDINPMATEIARLRAWLSLIVEDMTNDNMIEPLPNLDFKFVSANSLVPLANTTGIDSDPDLDIKLSEIRQKYFNARLPHTKKTWQDKYYELTDTFSLFDDKRTDQLRSFNPFNNSLVAGFFDSNFMFGVEDGFDICIGNPPYIHFQKMSIEDREYYKNISKDHYYTYAARGDIYTLFYEHGINLLKNKGVLSFITSNKWMRSGYGKDLRNYMLEKANPIKIMDLGSGIFESATVDTNILIAAKELNDNTLKSFNIHSKTPFLEQVANNESDLINFKKDSLWVILNEIEQSIKNKIENNGKKISEWNLALNRGILTGLNEAFIISKEKKDELIALDPRSNEVLLPLLRGRDIDKNEINFNELYLIGLFPAKNYNIDDYPAIKDWLVNGDWVQIKTRSNPPTSIGTGKLRLEQTGAYHEVNGIKFKSRKKTSSKWFETQDNIAYWNQFNEKKIVFSRISGERPKFALDDNGYVINDTAYLIVGSDIEYIFNYLISDTIWFAFKLFYMGGGINNEFKLNNLYDLPIPTADKEINLTAEEEEYIHNYLYNS